jgi:hypothetical protein
MTTSGNNPQGNRATFSLTIRLVFRSQYFHERPAVLAVTFHIPTFYHGTHRAPYSEPQMLIPPRTHPFEITIRQHSQLSQKDRPLSRYDFIQADDRRLEQTRLTPIVDTDIHAPHTQPTRDATDDDIFAKFEKDKRRPDFRPDAIRVRKTAKINLAEHCYWAGASDS